MGGAKGQLPPPFHRTCSASVKTSASPGRACARATASSQRDNNRPVIIVAGSRLRPRALSHHRRRAQRTGRQLAEGEVWGVLFLLLGWISSKDVVQNCEGSVSIYRYNSAAARWLEGCVRGRSPTSNSQVANSLIASRRLRAAKGGASHPPIPGFIAVFTALEPYP
jgi:hypothetical protein